MSNKFHYFNCRIIAISDQKIKEVTICETRKENQGNMYIISILCCILEVSYDFAIHLCLLSQKAILLLWEKAEKMIHILNFLQQ